MDPKALRDLFGVLRQRRKGVVAPVFFPGSDLRGAHLLRADLIDANFEEARLDHSNLEGAQLGGARLFGASLCGVSLNGADLTDADLRQADLSEARLEGVCLAGADLSGARLARAYGQPGSLAGARIDSAMCDRSGLDRHAIIEMWRDGAELLDLDAFPDSVRLACAKAVDDEHDQLPNSRRIFDAELDARRGRLRSAQSIPPSSRRATAWRRISEPPPRIIDSSGEVDVVQITIPDLPPPSLSRPLAPAYKAGDVLLGARLIERLGKGESGTVWKAELADGKLVAVKYFDQLGSSLGLRAPAFRQGIRSLSRVMMADVAVAAPTLYCVSRNELAAVMEFFPNGNAESLPALKWDVPALVGFFKRLCRQVGELHELGMAHRCIKPKNILVDDDLLPVLTDMNSVNFEEVANGQASDYRIYAAPEELTGMGTQSPTADVYSLGRVLHFLLLGTDPGPQVHDVPPLDSLAEAPPGLVRIIRKATVQDATQRYQWIAELLEDLENYAQHEDVGMARQGPMPGDFHYELSSLPPGRPHDEPLRDTLKPERTISAGAPKPPRPFEHERLRPVALAGAAGVALCALYLLFDPTPSPDAASWVGIALTACLAAVTLWVKPVGPRPVLFSGVLAALAATVVTLSEPERIAILRWQFTLAHGQPAQRAEVTRYLARRAFRNLQGADLSLTNLSGADLSRVDFSRSNLAKANLAGAILLEANFAGADVKLANFRSADLFGSNVFEARGWSETTCDTTTAMPREWFCNDGSPAKFEPNAAAR